MTSGKLQEFKVLIKHSITLWTVWHDHHDWELAKLWVFLDCVPEVLRMIGYECWHVFNQDDLFPERCEAVRIWELIQTHSKYVFNYDKEEMISRVNIVGLFCCREERRVSRWREEKAFKLSLFTLILNTFFILLYRGRPLLDGLKSWSRCYKTVQYDQSRISRILYVI